ncbi:MAG: DUF423 domain-containing protein [Gammaproteobacteria bacterium]|nr:DUF423 domain-containing protein [Gammaproteobacteria bacterium]MBU1653462.1 DUF423 domain-containing protein [Gammaproteobacteria bacterium]MBU1960819.1 DUF423 domain-containing protein [Gammaproteobacteria bacterium]
MTAKTMITAGAIFGFLTVALGAFGAHVMEQVLAPEMLRIWEKAVDYQALHALALLATGLLALGTGGQERALRIAGYGFVIGMLLFSGSLYLLAITGIKGLGAITPLGGIAFLVGWAALVQVARKVAP